MQYQIQNTVLRRFFTMSEGELPPGFPPQDRPVLLFLEGVGLALAFGGVESLVRGGPVWLAIVLLAFSLAFFYSGFKWPSIKVRLTTGIVSALERITKDYRYRVAMVIIVLFCVGSSQLVYMYHVRRDLDTYSLPRGVANSQAETIRRVLRGSNSKGTVTVVYSSADEEAMKYASALCNAISGGGWEVLGHCLNPWEAATHTNEDGIFDSRCLITDVGVVVRHGFVGQRQNSAPRNPASEPALLAAFQDAGIEFRGGDDNKSEYPLVLEVGRRPLAFLHHPRFRERLFHWVGL
jgi:hypothetical protein